jgi:hypothetical protein
MQSTQPAYFSQYRSLKLTRDAQGVLVAEFHSNGFPLICTAQDHTEFGDAFNRISQDRANQIVILAGTGGGLSQALILLSSLTSPILMCGIRYTMMVFRFESCEL